MDEGSEGRLDAVAPVLAPDEVGDPLLRDRFAAAFGPDAEDAWMLLADPAAAPPSGAPTPADRLRAARAGLYRRSPTGREEYDRVAERVCAERRAALTALAAARAAMPAERSMLATPRGSAASGAVRSARRPLLIAGIVVVALLAVVAALAPRVVQPAHRTAHPTAQPSARLAVAFPVQMTGGERSRVDSLFAHAATDPVDAVRLTQHLLGDARQVLANDGALAADGSSSTTGGARQSGIAVGLAAVDVPEPDGVAGDTLLVVDLARPVRWRAVVTRRDTGGESLRPIEVSGSPADGRIQVVRMLAGLDGVAQTARISAPGVRFAFAVMVEDQ